MTSVERAITTWTEHGSQNDVLGPHEGKVEGDSHSVDDGVGGSCDWRASKWGFILFFETDAGRPPSPPHPPGTQGVRGAAGLSWCHRFASSSLIAVPGSVSVVRLTDATPRHAPILSTGN